MANWCILHSHGNYGSHGRKSYILIRSGYKDKESARVAAKSGRYGDVAGDHRIVKKSQVKPIMEKGKRVKALYEVRGLLGR